MFSDIDLMLKYDDEYMKIRNRYNYYATSLLFTDCIEYGKSFTKGACRYAITSISLIGITNVIDSLCIIKQFVFDENITTMQNLIDALKNDWQGHDILLYRIKKKGEFFGNDDETSNYVAKLFLILFMNTQNTRKTFSDIR